MGVDKFGFGKIKTLLFKQLKPELPKQIAQHMLLYYRTNYNKEGYTPGKTFIPWQKRKYAVDRKLLVKSGDMRDSLAIATQEFGSVSIGSDTEYFEYHQEGTETLPARPMVYESDELNDQIEKIIEENIWKLFK